MYACMYIQGCVRLGLVLGRHPKINLFGYTAALLVVKWRQNTEFRSHILHFHLVPPQGDVTIDYNVVRSS